MNLLLALGVDPNRAQAIVAGILDWRGGTPGGSFTEFDQYYLSLTPSFRARHASLQEIEELLLVRGITPDLFYGSYTPDAEGRLIPHDGLRDCLSVFGSPGAVGCEQRDAGSDGGGGRRAGNRGGHRGSAQGRAHSRPGTTGSLERRRERHGPARDDQRNHRDAARYGPTRLPNGQLSDLHRTVSAMVKLLGTDWNPPFHILRWYDNASILQ